MPLHPYRREVLLDTLVYFRQQVASPEKLDVNPHIYPPLTQVVSHYYEDCSCYKCPPQEKESKKITISYFPFEILGHARPWICK